MECGRCHHPMVTAAEEVSDTLDGRVALVTGGTRGIGHAAARGLAQAGATVIVLGTDAVRALQVAREMQDDGLDVVGVGVDVSDARAVAELPQFLGPLGAVDVLVNSAGVMSDRRAKTVRTAPEEWRRVMSVNLDGSFYAISTFVPGMVERGWGRVINVSACLGRLSGPGTAGGLAPYRVSKAAVNAMTRNLAAELQGGAKGVLVDAMCPAHCRTDMGGPDAPRSAEEGADTIVWLATRAARADDGQAVSTGLLWEDRVVVPW